MIRYRGVGKVRFISTPNRNEIRAIEMQFHETRLGWVLSVQCLSVRARFIKMCECTLTIYHSA